MTSPRPLRSRRLRSAVLACSALTAAVLAGGPARAETSAEAKELSFTTQNIYQQEVDVVSTDGKTWNKIQPGNVLFGAHVNIDTRTYVFAHGWVRRAGIVMGACGGSSCTGRPLLWSASPMTKDYENQMTVSMPVEKIPVSSATGIATMPHGDEILGKCNAKLTPAAAPAHSFFYLMPVTFVADTFVAMSPSDASGTGGGPKPAQWFGDTDHATSNQFAFKVNCKPFEVKRNVDGVVAEEPKVIKTSSIELFRTTYSHATSQPNPGTVCKKARLLVRVKTNKAGPVKFKLWTKVGDAPMASKVIDAWSSHAGPGVHKAEYAEWVEVDKTSYVQAMAEDMTNPIGQTTGWKDITLHCTGAGGGGLADQPKPDQDGPVPMKVSGELTLADKAGLAKPPRQGQAVFKIWSNKPGPTSYRLTCTGGREWEGTLPTFKIAPYKYQAVGAQNFDVAKTEQIGCALRSTSMPKDNVIAIASRLYEVIVRNPDFAGPGGLTAPPKPTHAAPPQRLVGPGARQPSPPAISCIGGKSTGTACFCPGRTVKVQTGPNAYRCTFGGFAAEPGPRPGPKVMTAPNGAGRPMMRPGARESALGQRRVLR